MDFDIDVIRHERYRHIVMTGAPGVDQFISAVHLIGVRSQGWRSRRLLIDLRKVTTRFTEAEEREIGVQAGTAFPHMKRMASLVPPGRITRNSERAALRNGAQVKVFDDAAEALAWLLAD